MGQRRPAHLGIALTDLPDEPAEIFGDELELLPDVAFGGFVARDVEAALERFERGGELGRVDRGRAADPDRRDQRRKVADDLELLGLVLGNEEQHRVDFGDARQGMERLVLLAQLVEGVRARKRGEAGASGRRENALLPDDGLGPRRLEIEQVVVELDIAQAPRRDRRQGGGHDQHGLRVRNQPLDERHVHALERDGARDRAGRAPGVSTVDEDQDRREHGHHREPGKDDRGARDEPELAHAAEVSQPQDVEGTGGGDGAEQHARPGPSGGDLDRFLEVPSEEELLFVAEEKVDSVVDADANHDRDEHHREQREVPDHERGDPDRPAEAQGEHQQHQHRLAEADERRQQEPEGQREGQQGRALAIVEGGDHLVVLERRLAGDPDRHLWELALERGDHAADALDGALVAREAPALALGLGQDEEQLLVFGQEVAGAGIVRTRDREQGPEGRLVRPGAVQPRPDQRHQVLNEFEVGGALTLGQAEVDEVRHERVRDLRGHPLG